MKKLLSMALLLVAACIALAACGDNPATATAVPTVEATSTTAPIAVAATATISTAAMPTGTIAPTAEISGSDMITAVISINSGPDAAAWSSALSKMERLQSYHQVRQIGNSLVASAGKAHIESDVIPPATSHITITTELSGTTTMVEVISIDQESWVKADSTNNAWVKSTAEVASVANFGLSNSGGYKEVTKVAEETMNGVMATRYSFKFDSIDPNTQEAVNGAGEGWVADDTGYLLRINIGSTQQIYGQMVQVTSVTEYSRFNDPTIMIEAPTP